MLFVYKVNMLLRGVRGELIWQENRFRPGEKASLLLCFTPEDGGDGLQEE